MADRFTGITGDQIEDGSVEPSNLNYNSTPTTGNLLAYHSADQFITYPLTNLVEEYYAASDTVTSSTTTVYTDKVTLTVTPLATDDYMLFWHCELVSSNSNRNLQIQILKDGISQTEVGEYGQYTFATGIYFNLDGFQKFALTPISTTFKIQFKTNSGTIYIKNARLMLRRFLG